MQYQIYLYSAFTNRPCNKEALQKEVDKIDKIR